VLVATPGRLLDLMNQRHVDLSRVEIFVLDEADRMLDMGFLRDVRRVVEALGTKRQSLLFSATMPRDIVKLAQSLLQNPIRVEVTPPSSTVDRVEQRVHFVEKQGKRALLSAILQDRSIERTLVFTRTKHGADRVARHLEARGIHSAALHGNKSQGQRERALAAFREGQLRVLVATDIAARGLDVPGITHVINFDLPNVPESYVHRIGRTARAGRDGIAISFCDESEQAYLVDIQKEIRRDLDVVGGSPRTRASAPPPATARKPAQRSRSGGRSGSSRRGSRQRY
jgi:ATP-dependent RNA helicase RhlE